MGKIITSITDLDGNKTSTTVTTNRLEDALINFVERFGRDLSWRLVHRIEKRKLAKQ